MNAYGCYIARKRDDLWTVRHYNKSKFLSPTLAVVRTREEALDAARDIQRIYGRGGK